MSNNVFSLCLISVFSLSLLTSGSAAETNLKDTPVAKVHTLSLPGMELKGEEIDYKIQGDGKYDISLRSQAMLKIDEVVITADFIHGAYSKKESMVLDLKGNVQIVSYSDKLRANAMEAKFEFGPKLIMLKGEAKQEALLVRFNGLKVTHTEATEIQIQFTEQNTVSIKSQGPVEISERMATKEENLFFSYRSNSQNGSQNTLDADFLGVPATPKFEIPPQINTVPQF